MADVDVYIVLDGGRVVGVSARLQGAEVIRADEAARLAADKPGWWMPGSPYDFYYDRMRVENHNVRDMED